MNKKKVLITSLPTLVLASHQASVFAEEVDVAIEEPVVAAEVSTEETLVESIYAVGEENGVYHTLDISVVTEENRENSAIVTVALQEEGIILADNQNGTYTSVNYEVVNNATGETVRTNNILLVFEEIQNNSFLYLPDFSNGDYIVNSSSNYSYESADRVLHYYGGQTPFAIVGGKLQKSQVVTEEIPAAEETPKADTPAVEETKESQLAPSVDKVRNDTVKVPVPAKFEVTTVPVQPTYGRTQAAQEAKSSKSILLSTGEAVSLLSLVGAGLSALGLVGFKDRHK